mgnify:CR=1 FL=1
MIANELNFHLLGTAIVLFHIGMLGLVLNRGNILPRPSWRSAAATSGAGPERMASDGTRRPSSEGG